MWARRGLKRVGVALTVGVAVLAGSAIGAYAAVSWYVPDGTIARGGTQLQYNVVAPSLDTSITSNSPTEDMSTAWKPLMVPGADDNPDRPLGITFRVPKSTPVILEAELNGAAGCHGGDALGDQCRVRFTIDGVPMTTGGGEFLGSDGKTGLGNYRQMVTLRKVATGLTPGLHSLTVDWAVLNQSGQTIKFSIGEPVLSVELIKKQ